MNENFEAASRAPPNLDREKANLRSSIRNEIDSNFEFNQCNLYSLYRTCRYQECDNASDCGRLAHRPALQNLNAASQHRRWKDLLPRHHPCPGQRHSHWQYSQLTVSAIFARSGGHDSYSYSLDGININGWHPRLHGCIYQQQLKGKLGQVAVFQENLIQNQSELFFPPQSCRCSYP